MTPEQFCYWLHGFFELQDADKRERPAGISEEQRSTIRDHLDLVFNKVTPDHSTTKKKVILEKTKPETLEEVIEEMKHNRPGVTCPDHIRIC